jgi:hypothetical protein
MGNRKVCHALAHDEAEAAETLDRFDALWNGEVLDRPPITANVKPSRVVKRIECTHATLRDRWMDVEFNVMNAIYAAEATDFPLDALPVYMPNVGPELTGTIFGCDLKFGEHTSWSVPIIHEQSDWSKVPSITFDFTNPYWLTIEAMTRLALDVGAGKVLTGIADLHGNFDILASLREPIELCIDVAEAPELLREACAHVSRGFEACWHRNWNLIKHRQPIATTWMPFIHAGPAYVPSSDFWCMVGPDETEHLIKPFIEFEMKPLQRSIFHLDGPRALRHLDLVLALPGLNAVQWQYGSNNGPANKRVDTYRRIQNAGKGVLIHAIDAADALACVDSLSPRGMWLMLDTPFSTAEEAESFGREVERRMRQFAR